MSTWITWAVGVPLALGVSGGLAFIADGPALSATYAKFQIPLFSGFLTLAGFLLSLKTSILLRLHSDVFSQDWYRDRVNRHSLNLGRAVNQFSPLTRLGSLLINSVVVCLLAALSQLTLGNLRSTFAQVLCLLTAVIAAVLVVCSWYYVRANLQLWFEHLVAQDKKLQHTQEQELAKADRAIGRGSKDEDELNDTDV